MTDDREDKRIEIFETHKFTKITEFEYDSIGGVRTVQMTNFNDWEEFIIRFFLKNPKNIETIGSNGVLLQKWDCLRQLQNRPQLIGIKQFEDYLYSLINNKGVITDDQII